MEVLKCSCINRTDKTIHQLAEKNEECKICKEVATTEKHENEIGKTDSLIYENLDCLSDDGSESGRLEIDTDESVNSEDQLIKTKIVLRKSKFIYPAHIHIIHGKPVKYECKICTKKFKSKNMRKYHLYCDRRIPKPNQCEICGKRFIKNSHLNHHMQTHSIEGPKKCRECDKSYLHDIDLRLHEFEHEKDFKYSCHHKKCNQQFPTKVKLKAHEKGHHNNVENLKHFKCDHCDLSFTLKGNLMKHQVIHSGDKHFTCSFCNKNFPRKAALQSHILTHKTREFECKECGRAFTDSKNLERHLKVHQTMKEFTCSECGLTGKRKDNLVRHVRNFHHDITPPSRGVIVKKDLKLREKLRVQAKECVKKKNLIDMQLVKPPPIDNRVSVIQTVGTIKQPIKSNEPEKSASSVSNAPEAEIKKIEKKIDQFEIYRRILQPEVDDNPINGDDSDYPDFFKRRETKKETTNFNFSKIHWRHKFFIENNMKTMK